MNAMAESHAPSDTDGSSSDGPDAPPEPDLRVARVARAEDHPDADRLLLLQLDTGAGTRQVVAGLVGHYEPEELEGRHVVVVANLEPARLRGRISEGMVLAAEDEEGTIGLVEAPGAEPGAVLRRAGAPPPPDSISFADFQAHDLVAGPDGITLDGDPLQGAELQVDGHVTGPVR
jgi:methionine--tRNA ligase beta chain